MQEIFTEDVNTESTRKYFVAEKTKYIYMSNEVIRSKKKTTLFLSKVKDMAQLHLQNDATLVERTDSKDNKYYASQVVVTAQEIAARTGRQGNSIYADMKENVEDLRATHILITSSESDRIVDVSLYSSVIYEEGRYIIEYNPVAEKLMKDFEKTKYSKIREDIFHLSNHGAYELYKILETVIYKLPKLNMEISQEQFPAVSLEISPLELKYELGYINIDQPDIAEEARKQNPDFEKIAEMEINPRYKRLNDFLTRVVMTAVKEINDKSDIYICDVKKVRNGKGGKIKSLIFYVQHNKKYYEYKDSMNVIVEQIEAQNEEVFNQLYDVVENEASDELELVLNQIIDYVSDTILLTKKQAKMLYLDAKGDADKVYRAYDASKTQRCIKNLMGWLRTYIQLDTESVEPIVTVYGDAEKGRAVTEMEKSVQKVRNSSSAKEKIWQSFMKKPMFQLFLEENDITIEILNLLDVDERIDMFLDYKKKKDLE